MHLLPYGIDLGAEFGEQLARYRISRAGVVEAEDADVAEVGGGDVADGEEGGGASCGGEAEGGVGGDVEAEVGAEDG